MSKIVTSDALLRVINNDVLVWTVAKLSGVYKYVAMFI